MSLPLDRAERRAGHQPRIVYDCFATCSQPVPVRDPESSQAFYGELHDRPDYYVISQRAPFHFTLGIATPFSSDASQNFRVEIRSADGKLVHALDGSRYAHWRAFYEEFAGDTYYQGPSWDLPRAAAGDYLIEVSNGSTSNKGKYVLMVGLNERMNPDEMAQALATVNRLKQEYWVSGPTKFALGSAMKTPVIPRTVARNDNNIKLAGNRLAGAPAPPVMVWYARPRDGSGTSAAGSSWASLWLFLLLLLLAIALAWWICSVSRADAASEVVPLVRSDGDYYSRIRYGDVVCASEQQDETEW